MEVTKKILLQMTEGHLFEVKNFKELKNDEMFCGMSLTGEQLYLFCKDPKQEFSFETTNPLVFDRFLVYYYDTQITQEFDDKFKELTGVYIGDYVQDLPY